MIVIINANNDISKCIETSPVSSYSLSLEKSCAALVVSPRCRLHNSLFLRGLRKKED